MEHTPVGDRGLSSLAAPIQRVSWSAIIGYDLFISYRRSDATRYAAMLAEALRLADFRCFLDDNDATPGKPLTERLQRALRRSKVLLIVASPDLPLSTWVPKEVEIFIKTKRDIILINVKDGMSRAIESSTLGPLLNKDALWIDEEPAIGPGGTPSAYVIGSVQKNFSHRRANRNLRLIASAVTMLVAGFAVVAGWQWRTAVARLNVVQSQALAADARRLAQQEPYLAVKAAVAAFATSDTPDAETALLEGLSRIPKLRLFLPCAQGQKAVGVSFSQASASLLGYACLSYRQGVQQTTLRIVDFQGEQKYTATIAGDGRSFSFVDDSHLNVSMSDRIVTVDLRAGQPAITTLRKPPVPMTSSTNAIQGKLDEIAANCVREHPHSTRYFTAASSIDSHLLAYTTEANQIVIADQITGDCLGDPLAAHTHNILAIAWGPSSRYVASAGAIANGDDFHGVVMWDRDQVSIFARVIYKSVRPNIGDPKFALSADGSSWICGACDGEVIWNDQPIPSMGDPTSSTSVTMKPDGKEVAIARPDAIYVIRQNNGDFDLVRKPAPSAPVRALTYANDALYALDEGLNVWNVSSSAAATHVIPGPPFDSVHCFDPHPTGPYFLSEIERHGSEVHLKLAEPKSGEVKDIQAPSDSEPCAAITFSPGAMIAVRTNAVYQPFVVVNASGRTRMEKMANPLRQSAGLPTVLRNARLSYDGRRLVASSDNSSLAVFDLSAARMIGSIDLGEVTHVALAANGNFVLVAGDGKILLIDLDPASWNHKATQLVAQSTGVQ